jgi:hypothetical protein
MLMRKIKEKRYKALSLAKEYYAMKLDLLTNTAIRFVNGKTLSSDQIELSIQKQEEDDYLFNH